MNKLNFSKFILGLFLVLITISCSEQDDIVIDPGGFAEYIIDNQSSELLIFSDETSSIEIIPGELEVIFFGAFLAGVEPPSAGLRSLTLLRIEDGTFVTALEIDPIIDEQWIEEIISDSRSNFTLIVTDEMLN